MPGHKSANLLPCDGTLFLVPDATDGPAADCLFAMLRNTIEWQSEAVAMFGKRIPVPRLVAWHGEAAYTYSGIVHQPRPWTPELLMLRAVAEEVAGAPFNSVLLNLYRNGRDGMGWHADDEKELGPEPVIASLSLGAGRWFQVRHRRDKSLKLSFALPHGACLVMGGAMQQNWLHQVPKTTRPAGPRINLTFRRIVFNMRDV